MKGKGVVILKRDLAMAGTEGTGLYQVVVDTKSGKLGYRDLGYCLGCNNKHVRIRLEPKGKKAAEAMAVSFYGDEWKKPGEDGQNRFSTVTGGIDEMSKLVGNDRFVLALRVALVGAKRVRVATSTPDWAIALIRQITAEVPAA